MSMLLTTSGLFGRRCRFRWRFAHHRMPFSPLDPCPLRSTGRFSAWLGRTCRCPKLRNNPPQCPSYLAWRCGSVFRLPRSAFRLDLRLRQHQRVMHDRDQICPALHLLGRSHARCGPQQILLVEAIPVFLAKSPRIQSGQFGHRRRANASNLLHLLVQ